MHLQRETTSYGASSDLRWLGSPNSLAETHGVSVVVAELVAAVHYPDGYIPSGTCLGKITTGGLFKGYESDAVDGSEDVVCINAWDVAVPKDADGVLLATNIVVAAIYRAEIILAHMPAAVEANGSTAHPIVAADLPAGFVVVES